MKEKYSFDQGEEKEKERFSSTFVYLMTLGVTLGAVCFGYNIAVISGAMLFLQPHFSLDTTWQSVIVGAAIISATVSSLMTGRVADKIGRRLTLTLTALVCVIGPLLAAAAPNKEMLLAGRFVTGFTFPVGVAFGLVYLAEMSPASVRGRLLACNQVQVNLGILLSALASGAFSYLPGNQWRYMLGVAAVPGLLFGVAVFCLPESPRWLMANGRQSEATRVLQQIYGQEDVKQHVREIQQSLNSHQPTGPVLHTLSRLVKTRHVLRALAVGSCLSFFFAWSGINAVLSFCGIIIKMVGFPVEHAVWIQGLAALAMFLSTLPVLFAVERYGRRPIVLISLAGCAVSLTLVSAGFHLTSATSPDVQPFNMTSNSSYMSERMSSCDTYTNCEACIQNTDCGLCYRKMTSAYCLPARNERYSTLGPCTEDNQKKDGDPFSFAFDYCPSVYTWIAVAGIFLYCFLSQGLAALTFPINAEMYPMWSRSLCISLVIGLFWICNVIMTFSFLYLVQAFRTYGTFWFFAAMCAIGFVLVAIFLPETKNRSLEEVDELFMTSQELQLHHQRRERNQPVNDKPQQRSSSL